MQNFEAAKHCFLPEEEKEQLFASLMKAYGIIQYKNETKTKKTEEVPKPVIKMASWDDR